MKELNRKRLITYLTNLAEVEYQFEGELAEDFVNTVLNYALEAKLTSYKQINCFIDGLLTPSSAL